MKKTITFKGKISATSDKKKLKGGSKIYTYGTISIRDPKLTEYIGRHVQIKIIIDK